MPNDTNDDSPDDRGFTAFETVEAMENWAKWTLGDIGETVQTPTTMTNDTNDSDDSDDSEQFDYIPDARVQGGVPGGAGSERDIHPAVERHQNQVQVRKPTDNPDRHETAAALRNLADKLERGDLIPRNFTHDRVRPEDRTYHAVMGLFTELPPDDDDDTDVARDSPTGAEKFMRRRDSLGNDDDEETVDE